MCGISGMWKAQACYRIHKVGTDWQWQYRYRDIQHIVKRKVLHEYIAVQQISLPREIAFSIFHVICKAFALNYAIPEY